MQYPENPLFAMIEESTVAGPDGLPLHVLTYAGATCRAFPNPLRQRLEASRHPEDRALARSTDAWAYSVPDRRDGESTYSHPSEDGAVLMCRRFFVESGLLPVPCDNSHLDAEDAAIAAELRAAWEATPGVRVGDFYISGRQRLRICGHSWDGESVGTTPGGSFSLPARRISAPLGTGYSGGLDWPGIRRADLVEATPPAPGRFWFFSHGLAGAGRGVDVLLPCRVWQLADKGAA